MLDQRAPAARVYLVTAPEERDSKIFWSQPNSGDNLW